MTTRTLFLRCKADLDQVIRDRVSYAFRVFAAIYGYHVVDRLDSAEYCCSYEAAASGFAGEKNLHIPARYFPRPTTNKIPALKRVRYAGEDIHIIHGVDESGNPDWLGEIFEWLSSSLELPIQTRDAVGRIPYSETLFQRRGLSSVKPHAGLLMAWMENALSGHGAFQELPRAKSPVAGTEHMVICSHDLDFYYTNRAAAFRRLSKNLGISMSHYGSPSFFASNIRMMLGLLRGDRPGEFVAPMLKAIEEMGFCSTLFAVANGQHRRDPDYELREIAAQLREAVRRGFSVGVHSSYLSVVENSSLSRECATLEKTIGQLPKGSRQHWLRFDSHAKLINAIQDANLSYDSSLGFSEICGFRNGANFAFPPYDFAKEKPCSFLEIPLVIMDGSLATASRTSRKNPQTLADSVLAESRKLGWGGISVLWHNPMEPIQVPDEVNKVFWECASKRNKYAETWMSADEFLAATLPRYQAAGLLKESKFDAFDAHHTCAAD